MKYVIITIVSFLFLTFLGCGDNKKLSESEYSISDSTIYSFINEILVDTSIIYCNTIVSSDGEKLLFAEDSSVIMESNAFTTLDVMFIKKQIEERENFEIDSKWIKDKVVIPTDSLKVWRKQGNDTLWSKIRTNYSNGFCAIGLPVFSKDGNIALIKVSFIGGYKSGYGHTLILKRVNGKWAKDMIINRWIS